MENLSGNFLYGAFICYLLATFFFSGAIRDKKYEKNSLNKWSKIAFTITIIGFIGHISYFITRWIAAGHAPTSNLYEFMTAFGMMLVLAFIIMFVIYRLNLLGLFALPIALLIIAYASMFPREITPLIPSLQSDWLFYHVSTAALGQAILSISFIAGLIYLINTVDQSMKSKKTVALELIMFIIVTAMGFILISSTFKLMDYEATFTWIDKHRNEAEMIYHLPAIIGPNQGELLTEGKMNPIIEVPPIISGRKLNTVIWSFIVGALLYGLIRIILRKRISEALQPLTQKININLVDEVGYRSVIIGFPIFTLGGLIFAMIWAQIAWTRFWGWDPKEVWALITWLFYAAFLHLRLSKGWEGEKSAWLSVFGFAIIMFNLIFVNLVIAGLHSYA